MYIKGGIYLNQKNMKYEDLKVGQVVWYPHGNEFVTITKEPYRFQSIGPVADFIDSKGREHPLVPIGAFVKELVIPDKYKDLVIFE